MKKEFEKFFASHQNPRPFEHSALYIEFKELIPSGLKGLQIKQHFLHDLVALDLLEEAYETAIQISQTTKGYIQQETAIQAYLIANMLSDSQRINESSLYLPNNWNNFSIPESWNETLKQAFKIYK